MAGVVAGRQLGAAGPDPRPLCRGHRTRAEVLMARYRLTQPHYVTNRLRVPMYLEAGAIIDSADMPAHWVPTPACHPLDPEAEAEHAKVMKAAIAENGPHITGIGHALNLPRGKFHLC